MLSPLTRSQEVKLVLPAQTAHLLCARAVERWFTHVGVVSGDRRTTVQIFASQHLRRGMGASPIGTVTIVWDKPAPGLATIASIEWHPERGGSETAIRHEINGLVGWPVAGLSQAAVA